MAAPPVVVPGDPHLLLLTLAVTCAFQLSCFAVAWVLQFDTITDFSAGLNFIALSLLSFFLGAGGAGGGGSGGGRAVLITALAVATRLELGCFLLYRVLRRGKDARFDAMRGAFLPFLAFWLVQILWVWVVSLPCVLVNADSAPPPPLFADARDGVGLALFLVGFVLQTVADVQKDAFRGDPANRERVCDAGVWRYSRHPNFFGEMLIWWGIFILSTPQLDASGLAWTYVAVLSPLLTMALLLFLSGMPTAEGNNQLRFMKTPESKARFEAYRWRTSPLLPLPTLLYARVPIAVKRWLLCELSVYEATAEAEQLSPPQKDGAAQRVVEYS